MVVCICHRVTDRDIARAAQSGCTTLAELQDELRVATACGSCGDCAQRLLDDHCRPCGARRVPQPVVMEATA